MPTTQQLPGIVVEAVHSLFAWLSLGCVQMAGLPNSVVARAATIADSMRTRLEPAAAAAGLGRTPDAADVQVGGRSSSIPYSADDAAVLRALQQVLRQLQDARATAQQLQQEEPQQQQQGPCIASGDMVRLQGLQRDVLQLLEASKG
jgi:hypothetical protein